MLKGTHHTDETKIKLSIACKGRKLSEEHKKKISETHKKVGVGKWMKGRKLSEETRKKMSRIRKGREVLWGTKISKSLKGKPSGMLGKHHSLETRNKISGRNRGENGSNWKGGVSPINHKIRNGIEFRLWREAVFARDNWTCQKSGIRGGKLNPHHLQNFAEYIELRFAIDNGITFSEKAHKDFHKKYGQRNNTKEQLEEFLLTK